MWNSTIVLQFPYKQKKTYMYIVSTEPVNTVPDPQYCLHERKKGRFSLPRVTCYLTSILGRRACMHYFSFVFFSSSWLNKCVLFRETAKKVGETQSLSGAREIFFLASSCAGEKSRERERERRANGECIISRLRERERKREKIQEAH